MWPAASSSSLKPYPYDPEKAKSLLEEAGFPSGFSVSFKAPDGRYLQDKQVAEAIVGQLEKVGIKADLETTEWSTYVQGIVGRKYELFLLSQGGVQVGPAAQTNWSSKIKGIAWQGYENPKVDDLIDKAAKTVDAERAVASTRRCAGRSGTIARGSSCTTSRTSTAFGPTSRGSSRPRRATSASPTPR